MPLHKHLVRIAFIACTLITTAASAERPRAAPNHHEVKMMVMSTISAVNHANLTGNYSVLHALSMPEFQRINPPHRLAAIFLKQRRAGLDIAPALLYEPHLSRPVRVLGNQFLQLTGFLPTRPIQIDFDLHYQWSGAKWKITGLTITPRPVAPSTEVEKTRPRPSWKARLSQLFKQTSNAR